MTLFIMKCKFQTFIFVQLSTRKISTKYQKYLPLNIFEQLGSVNNTTCGNTTVVLWYEIHSGRPVCCFGGIQIICLSWDHWLPNLGNSKEQFLKVSCRLIITKSQGDVWIWIARKSNAMAELKVGVIISTTESRTNSYGTKLIQWKLNITIWRQ